MKTINWILALVVVVLLGGTIMLTKNATAAVSPTNPSPAQKAKHTSDDGLWQDADEVQMLTLAKGPVERRIVPQTYRLARLDVEAFKRLQTTIPKEFSAEARNVSVMITLPMPDGTDARFRIEESSIMAPELAAQFPEIKSYIGQGIDDPTATLRADWTMHGFHAQILTARDAIYIDPYAHRDTEHYISYYKRDYRREGEPFQCFFEESDQPAAAPPAETVTNGGTLRTFRLALAATVEYTQFHGGTVPAGLAAINTTMTRVNGVYERDLGVRMVLVADETMIIYTSTDPYSHGNAGSMISQNQSNLDSVIGSANYDIGHVIDTAGGGLAGLGVICVNGSKARGVTGLNPPVGDPFDIDYVAHEMGHQYGGNHTFNGTSSSCSGNRVSTAAYEPGSGATIMAYAGICGAANLQPNSMAIFHVRSLEEIVARLGSASCSVNTPTGNPTPTADPGANFTIPIQTPFTLTANGGGSGVLTYSWEEYDLGPSQNAPLTDNGSSPIFRSYDAVDSASRTFPSLPYILNNANVPPASYPCATGNCMTGEILPSTSRALKFQVVVRDNNAGGGGIASAQTQITSTTMAGPFQVTQPNTNVTWAAGAQTVTWNVANTSASPVNTANVAIRLSTDGGNTFPTLLTASTPNDGAETVTIPSTSTTTARIKVEAVGNIFFDVSNVNFTIGGGPPAATVTVTAPNGGESWQVGNAQTISWTTTGSIANVKIELSRDGGGSYSTLFNSIANDGSEPWTVTGPATTQARIRISDAGNASVNDTSNSNFTIQDAPPPPPPPPPGGCAATRALDGRADGPGILALLYQFRDGVLSQTQTGLRYTDVFYQFSPEMIRIMVSSPSVLLATQEWLIRTRPMVESLVNTGGAEVTLTEIEQTDRLLIAYSAQASPALKLILDQLRRDIRNPVIQAQMGIRVIRR
jgi:hypothetical protein